MQIQQNITNTNRTIQPNRDIKYLVIHYVGAISTAYNNTVYFKHQNRGASAHYFVDEKSIWQCVLDKDIAWHCGSETGKYVHSDCRNNNSIGIELCCKLHTAGSWYFELDTVINATWLVARLAKEYGIPASNILRHWDITGKCCPEPWVRDMEAWNGFLNAVKEEMEEDMIRYETINDVPDWGRDTVEKLIVRGALAGSGDGLINLSEDMLRILVINDRMGVYGE